MVVPPSPACTAGRLPDTTGPPPQQQHLHLRWLWEVSQEGREAPHRDTTTTTPTLSPTPSAGDGTASAAVSAVVCPGGLPEDAPQIDTPLPEAPVSGGVVADECDLHTVGNPKAAYLVAPAGRCPACRADPSTATVLQEVAAAQARLAQLVASLADGMTAPSPAVSVSESEADAAGGGVLSCSVGLDGVGGVSVPVALVRSGSAPLGGTAAAAAAGEGGAAAAARCGGVSPAPAAADGAAAAGCGARDARQPPQQQQAAEAAACVQRGGAGRAQGGLRSLKGILPKVADVLPLGGGLQSPAPSPRVRVEEEELNWTRDEDNAARNLRSKREAHGLTEAEVRQLQVLEVKEQGFLDGGVQNLKDIAVLLVAVRHCVLNERLVKHRNPRILAEVKLREVSDDGSVIHHSDPQKFTTKAVGSKSNCFLFDPEDSGKLLLKNRATDAVRVSVFTHGIVKEKACTFDVRAAEFLPQLAPGKTINRSFMASQGAGELRLSITLL